MPATVGSLCSRCGDYVDVGAACECGKIAYRTRRKVYDHRRWRNYTRPIVIAREHGICQSCGGPGNVVDHILPIETLLELDANPFNPAECQLLCLGCSGRKDGFGVVR